MRRPPATAEGAIGMLIDGGNIPAPDNVTTSGLVGASELIVSVPVRLPLVVGANCTSIEHDAPGATVVPQVEEAARTKSVDATIETIVSGSVPVLVSVSRVATEELPTISGLKGIVFPLSDTAEFGRLPVRVIVASSPVESEMKLPSLPNPTVNSMVSPAKSVALRLKACGMFVSKTFAKKSGATALSSRKTATSVVVVSRPTKLPTMLYVPDDGAVQRTTLFSPDGPGCRSSPPGGIGLLPAGLM